jgi:hypothetical protein
MNENVKLTINLTQDVARDVRGLADREGTTVTSIVNKSIKLEKYMSDAVSRGAKILVEERDGKTKEVFLR